MIKIKNVYGGELFISIDDVLAVDQCGYFDSDKGKDHILHDSYAVVLRNSHALISVTREYALTILQKIEESNSANNKKTYAIDDLMSAIDTVNSVRKMLSEIK